MGQTSRNNVWDEIIVRDWHEVATKAQSNGDEVNLGDLFGICVEKNSELPPEHPNQKFKGRVVVQGNRVVNQNWEAAVFQDLAAHLLPWTSRAQLIASEHHRAIARRLPTRSRHTSRPTCLARLAGFVFLKINVQRLGPSTPRSAR